jgi:hypothetical protein
MSEAPQAFGTVVDGREYCPLVVLYVEAEEGRLTPVPIYRFAFDQQMGGDGCPVIKAVGSSVTVVGGSVPILRRGGDFGTQKANRSKP